MWADHMGPIRDMSRQSGHGVEVGKLCGPHVVSVTWGPNGKPMWVDSMGPVRDISGQSGNGVELGDIIWDPYCISNMGPT